MKVSLDSLERYGDMLNAISSEASSTFSEEMGSYLDEVAVEYGDPSTWSKDVCDQVRKYATDLVVEKWSTYGDASSSIGSLFFEDTLGDEMPEHAFMSDHVSEERAEASVRYWMKNLFGDGADPGKFIDGCSSFVDRVVSHSADLTVLDAANALGAEGKRVKYGRVPVGPTCGFCIMLASRGFVYASKESAGDVGGFNRFHDKCNCRVVAGYDGLQVEGYDYEGMYRRYKACRETIGGLDQIEKDWESLTPEERSEYGRGERIMPLSEDPKKDAELRKRLGNQANGFNDYAIKRIVQEMDTRDRQWMYDNTPLPEPEKEPGAKPKKKEMDTALRLQENGYRVLFRKPTGDKRTSDVYLVSGKDDEPIKTRWEIKQPIGDKEAKTIGKNTIDHQFEDAIGQSRSLVLDVSVVTGYPGVSYESMITEAERLLKGKYSEEFDEVMVVCGNQVRKIKNR